MSGRWITLFLLGLVFVVAGHAQTGGWETPRWRYSLVEHSSEVSWELRNKGKADDLLILLEGYAPHDGAGVTIIQHLPKGGGCLQYSAAAAADKGDTLVVLRKKDWRLTRCHSQAQSLDVVDRNFKPDPKLLRRVVKLLDEVKKRQRGFWKESEPYFRELLPLRS